MRYSKSSLLSIALTFSVSAVAFTSSVKAQNTTADFPWRANARSKVTAEVKTQAKTKARAVVQRSDAFVNKVETAFTTPSRDSKTVETIATPTPSYESMPSVIYDDGKKFIRQGDTYIESSHLANVTNAAKTSGVGLNTVRNLTQHVPTTTNKTSLFQKTKGLTSRLNPFSTTRASSEYKAKDWKIPSFSKTLPVFSQKDNDPITFAAVAPLPAKTSTPSSIDGTKPLYAANEIKPSRTINTSPTLTLPARESQFTSALPTETKLTSVFGGSETDKVASSKFEPSKFKPVGSASKKLATFGSQAATKAKNLVSEVETGFSSAENIITQTGPHVSVFENKLISPTQPALSVSSAASAPTAPSARTASLSADSQFWSPRR